MKKLIEFLKRLKFETSGKLADHPNEATRRFFQRKPRLG